MHAQFIACMYVCTAQYKPHHLHHLSVSAVLSYSYFYRSFHLLFFFSFAFFFFANAVVALYSLCLLVRPIAMRAQTSRPRTAVVLSSYASTQGRITGRGIRNERERLFARLASRWTRSIRYQYCTWWREKNSCDSCIVFTCEIRIELVETTFWVHWLRTCTVSFSFLFPSLIFFSAAHAMSRPGCLTCHPLVSHSSGWGHAILKRQRCLLWSKRWRTNLHVLRALIPARAVLF